MTVVAVRKFAGKALCAASWMLAAGLQAQGTHARTLPDAPGFLQAAARGPSPATEPQRNSGTAAITGTITDMSGALVPGAKVHVTAAAGGAATEVTSGSAGEFVARDLQPGTYILTVSAPGLETFQSAPTTVRAGEVFEVAEIALAVPAQHADVTVTMTETQLAEVEMKAEEHQRVLAIFPNFYTSFVWDPAPLNTRQKFNLAFHSVLDPVSFATSAAVAGVEQANGTFPGFGPGPAGYGKRFGAAYGDQLLGRLIGSALLPSVLRQDPRYFYMGEGSSTRQRLIHALEFSVISRGDSGRRQPAYSHLLGNAAAGALSATYHPGENAGTLAYRNALIGIGGAAVQGFVREFIIGGLTHGKPAYGKGKPPASAATPHPTNTED